MPFARPDNSQNVLDNPTCTVTDVDGDRRKENSQRLNGVLTRPQCVGRNNADEKDDKADKANDANNEVVGNAPGFPPQDDIKR